MSECILICPLICLVVLIIAHVKNLNLDTVSEVFKNAFLEVCFEMLLYGHSNYNKNFLKDLFAE